MYTYWTIQAKFIAGNNHRNFYVKKKKKSLILIFFVVHLMQNHYTSYSPSAVSNC